MPADPISIATSPCASPAAIYRHKIAEAKDETASHSWQAATCLTDGAEADCRRYMELYLRINIATVISDFRVVHLIGRRYLDLVGTKHRPRKIARVVLAVA